MMRVLRHNRFGIARLAAVAVLCSVCGGCSRDEHPAWPGAHLFEESRSVASDALTVSLHVSSTRISIADRLTVLIEVRSVDGRWTAWPDELRNLSEGAPFGMADPPSALAPWTVFAARRQVVAPGHEMLTLTLEPYLPGEKSIPAIRFGDGRGSVQTERVAVHVASVADAPAAEADGSRDPLAAIERLGPMLAPASIEMPVWRRPLVVGVVGGAMVVLALGLGGTWAARRIMHRIATPDTVFRRTMDEVRARAGGPDADPARSVEDTLAALRAYLVSRRLLAPGATGPELAGALTGCAHVGLLGRDAVELAALLAFIEDARFGPSGGPTGQIATKLVEIVCRIADPDGQHSAPERGDRA
ncbi:MAG: hypothetical protein KF699_08540 [Phycisphaeraceae bacterium]|nr:hypothetical protein [Phycisphaeraceae bacterium]MBX3406148.1 hypothetical protein [Phycisphaeraceae bacterium]